MIKKNDLVKQFELLTIQEMRNHQKTIEETNKTINSLRNEIENIKKEMNAKNSSFHSSLSYHDSKLKENQILIIGFNEKINSFFNDCIDLNLRLSSELLNNENILNKHSLVIDEINYDLKNLKNKLLEIEENNNKIVDSIRFDTEKNYIHLNICIKQIHNYLLTIPQNHDELTKEFKKIVDECRVDFDGLMKEINVLKKNDMVIEKNIENLYSINKRLKVGE